jgi:hypothetical protein
MPLSLKAAVVQIASIPNDPLATAEKAATKLREALPLPAQTQSV